MAVAAHARVPGAVANLFLGLDHFMRFAEEIGAINATAAQRARGQFWGALLSVAQETGMAVADEKPASRFLEGLQGLLAEGGCSIVARAEIFGAKSHPCESMVTRDWSDRGLIGCWDDEYIYLKSAPTLKAVKEFTWRSGDSLPIEGKELKRELVREHILNPGTDRRTTVVVRIGERPQRVLRLSRPRVRELLGEDLVRDEVTGVTAVTGSGAEQEVEDCQ